MFNKKGNANARERIALMERVCQHIPTSEIRASVADREFMGRKWFQEKIKPTFPLSFA